MATAAFCFKRAQWDYTMFCQKMHRVENALLDPPLASREKLKRTSIIIPLSLCHPQVFQDWTDSIINCMYALNKALICTT